MEDIKDYLKPFSQNTGQSHTTRVKKVGQKIGFCIGSISKIFLKGRRGGGTTLSLAITISMGNQQPGEITKTIKL